jgi:hypothetical protein
MREPNDKLIALEELVSVLIDMDFSDTVRKPMSLPPSPRISYILC